MIADQEITNYVQQNARDIDRAVFDFHFGGRERSVILNALKPYQNHDGGFGNAIEPDFRLPQSTAIATCMALEFMDMTTDPGHIRRRALDYLSNTYDKSRGGWEIVCPKVDRHPHAPWWGYQSAMNTFGWGNPSAELLGFLIKYNGDASLISALTEKALTRIQQVNPDSFHEVQNFKALYHKAGDDLKQLLQAPLEQLISDAVVVNPDGWTAYVATPLKFITAPDDPFIHLFKSATIAANLEFIINDIVDGNHWAPNWDWSGDYPSDWQRAKQEWCGYLTVRNMLTLKKFGAIKTFGA